MCVLSGLEQFDSYSGCKEEDDAYKAMREDLQEILGGINIVSSKIMKINSVSLEV